MNVNISEMKHPKIERSEVRNIIKRTNNCKVPGIEKVQNIQIRKDNHTHEPTNCMLQLNNKRKVRDMGMVYYWRNNYAPKRRQNRRQHPIQAIQYVSTMHKIVSAIITSRLKNNISDNDILE